MSEALTMTGSLNQSSMMQSTVEPELPKKRLTFLETHNETSDQEMQQKEDFLQTTCGKIDKRFSRFSVYNNGLGIEEFQKQNPALIRNHTEIKEEDESFISETAGGSRSNIFANEESQFQFQNHSLYRKEMENENIEGEEKKPEEISTLIRVKRATTTVASSGISNADINPKRDISKMSSDTENSVNTTLSEQDVLLFSRSSLTNSTTGGSNRKSLMSGGFRLSIMKEGLIQSRFQEELLNQALNSMSKSSLESSLLKSGLYRAEMGKSLIQMKSEIDYDTPGTQVMNKRASFDQNLIRSGQPELHIQTKDLQEAKSRLTPSSKITQGRPGGLKYPELSTIPEKTGDLHAFETSKEETMENFGMGEPNFQKAGHKGQQRNMFKKAKAVGSPITSGDKFLMENVPGKDLFMKKSRQKIEEIGYRDSTDINNTEQKSIINFYNHWKLQEEAAGHNKNNGKIEDSKNRFYDIQKEKIFKKRLNSLISNTPERESGDFDIFNADFDSSMLDSSHQSREQRNTLHSISTTSRNSNFSNQKNNEGFMSLLSETNRSSQDARNSMKSWGKGSQYSDRDSLFGGKMSLLSEKSRHSHSFFKKDTLISGSSGTYQNGQISVLGNKVMNQQRQKSMVVDKSFTKKLSIQDHRFGKDQRNSTADGRNIPSLKSQFSDNFTAGHGESRKSISDFRPRDIGAGGGFEMIQKRDENADFMFGKKSRSEKVNIGNEGQTPGKRHSNKDVIRTFDEDHFRGSLLIIKKSGSGYDRHRPNEEMSSKSEKNEVGKKTEAESSKTGKKPAKSGNYQNVETLIKDTKEREDIGINDSHQTLFDVSRDFPNSSENYLSNLLFNMGLIKSRYFRY